MVTWCWAPSPAPDSGQLHLGPLRLTAYGLMIALGVLAAVEVCRRRAPARGLAPDDFSVIALWAVPAGLIGARLYHVITDWRRFEGHWLDAVKPLAGRPRHPRRAGGGRRGRPVGGAPPGLCLADAADVGAPALPLAQAIGRWGNWWNQELFGRPTSLPWGLEIDRAHRPAALLDSPTFHPTFLYESLWNLGLCVALVLRRSALGDGVGAAAPATRSAVLALRGSATAWAGCGWRRCAATRRPTWDRSG